MEYILYIFMHQNNTFVGLSAWWFFDITKWEGR